LQALDYAVNSLVPVVVGRSILLMLLEIGAAPHIGAEARPASFGWDIMLGHGIS
jgi:hypothetical protein